MYKSIDIKVVVGKKDDPAVADIYVIDKYLYLGEECYCDVLYVSSMPPATQVINLCGGMSAFFKQCCQLGIRFWGQIEFEKGLDSSNTLKIGALA